MSYHPTLGRFLERDPMQYKDSVNLYEYARGNPQRYVDPLGLQAATTRPDSVADFFDDPKEGALVRIAGQAAALGWIYGHLDRGDQANVEIFVKTQIAILSALANNDCPCLNKHEEQWLFDTVRDFVRPLSESLWERAHAQPVTDAGWKQFFKDMDAGAFKKVKLPVKPLAIVVPEPVDFVPEILAIARAMALNHINNDLKAALQKNGIGRQGLWDCIGKVVDKASHQVVGPALGPGMDIVSWWDDAWNVSKIRDQMRAGLGATQPSTQPATAPTTSPTKRPS